jgi:hypothetical protein
MTATAVPDAAQRWLREHSPPPAQEKGPPVPADDAGRDPRCGVEGTPQGSPAQMPLFVGEVQQ